MTTTEKKTTSKAKVIITALQAFFTGPWFKNFWKYIAFLLAGAVTGLLAAMKWNEKPTIVNGTLIKEQSSSINKLKQKGEGNNQQTEITQAAKKQGSRRQQRKAKRQSKKQTKIETNV